MSLIALAMLLGQAAAPPPDYSVDVRHAAGRPHGGGWQPYLVEVDNRAAVERDFRVELKDTHTEAAAVRTERLGPGARKRFHVYLPLPPGAWGAQVRHRVAVGREAPTAWSEGDQIRWQGNQPAAALLSPDPAAPDAFGLPVSGDRPLEVGRFSTLSFPDRRIGLAGYAALILHDPAWDEFTVDQGRALADYVRGGGLLILSPGPRAGTLSHPVLKEIVQVESRGLEEVRSAEGFPGYAPLRSKEPYQAHRIANGLPFRRTPVRVFPAGLGEVRVVPFDVRRAPFDAWPGMRTLWQDLIFQPRAGGFSPAVLDQLPAATDRNRATLAGAVGDRVSPYPSLLLLGGLVAAFILILGPLNYGILRRRRAPLLAVVTLPGISFLLLGLLFAVGTAVKGVSLKTFSVRVLGAPEGAAWAREDAVLSLYSPSTRSYDVSGAPGFALTPLGRQAWEPGTPFAAETGAGITTLGLSLGQWQTLHLDGESVRPLGRGLRFSVEGGRARVENGTPFDLEGCAIQIPDLGGWVRIGPVAAGATALAEVARTPSLAEALGLRADGLAAAAVRPYGERGLAPRDGPRLLLAVVRESEPAGQVEGAGRAENVTLLAVPESAR